MGNEEEDVREFVVEEEISVCVVGLLEKGKDGMRGVDVSRRFPAV